MFNTSGIQLTENLIKTLDGGAGGGTKRLSRAGWISRSERRHIFQNGEKGAGYYKRG